MINHTEFTIDALPNEQLRVANISPVDLLAITTQIDFEKLQQTKTLITFCLENVEVKQGASWVPVKSKDREVYFPMGIENNLVALNQIFEYMMTNVITMAFQPSEE